MAENESRGAPTGGGSDGENKPVSVKVIIILIVVTILAAIALAFWLTRGSEEQGDETPVPEPGTVQVIPTPTVTPTPAPGGSGTSPTTTPQVEIDQRAPTTFRGNMDHDHIESMEEEIGHFEPDDPMAPENARPQDLSEYSVQSMFTVGLTPGMTWGEAFHRYDRYYTERLRNEGFKRWWDPAGPEHTLAWEMGSSPGSTARVLSFPTMTGEEWLDQDTMRFYFNVNQVYRTDSGTTQLPAFKVVADMVYTDGKWLLDDYYYPRGHEPTIH